jgi:DNA-binding transcriptional LysR family regulator
MELDLFRGVVPFVAVAEAKSFRGAAARLGVSPAAVSKAVQALEGDLKLTLFERSSRSVTLTREGALFFERCQPAVQAVMAARASAETSRKEPEGELTVSAPFMVAPLLANALALLRARHPRLWFRVLVTDRLTRLAEESVDVAVRIGPLEGAVVARKLRSTRLVIVASPSYLARAGTPSNVDDLADHPCLVTLAPNGKVRPWLFASGPRAVPSALVTDHAPTVVDAAIAGVGIAQALDFMVDEAIAAGKLVRLLDHEETQGPLVHAVCAPGRKATRRVREAFEALSDVMGQRLTA